MIYVTLVNKTTGVNLSIKGQSQICCHNQFKISSSEYVIIMKVNVIFLLANIFVLL